MTGKKRKERLLIRKKYVVFLAGGRAGYDIQPLRRGPNHFGKPLLGADKLALAHGFCSPCETVYPKISLLYKGRARSVFPRRLFWSIHGDTIAEVTNKDIRGLGKQKSNHVDVTNSTCRIYGHHKN